MGMRMSQPPGLPRAAEGWLNDNCIVKNPCLTCLRHNGFVTEEISSDGMFDDVSIKKYKVSDDFGGGWAKEFNQHTFWDSGPIIFLGLILPDGSIIYWSEEEIEDVYDQHGVYYEPSEYDSEYGSECGIEYN